jgi:hypothetical protein
MDIDDLTIKQAKELAAMFGSNTSEPSSPHIGKKCIIRTYASGVHFGELVAQHGRQVELQNARRLWRWDVVPHGISLSEVAVYGPTGSRSKICCVLAEMTLLDALEIIPCSVTAAEVIEAAEVYKP